MEKETAGHIAMLSFSALVAGSFALGHMAAKDIDPTALTAARFLLAAILVGTIAAIGPGIKRKHFRSPWRYAALGAPMAIYFVLMFVGLQTATAVSTSAVFTLTPLMSALFGWMLLRQITTPWIALALGIGAIGALWVIFRADLGAFLAFDIGSGETIFFFGCIAHALYTPLVPKLNRGEPTIVLTAGMLAAGAVLLIVLGFPRIAATPWLELSPIVYGVLAYLTIVTTGLTFFLVQFAAMRLPASKVMAYTYLTPSWVILWEAALGHGLPPGKVAFGAALTAVALIMLALRQERSVR